MHDLGLYTQKILTNREMVNFKKLDFLRFLTINSVTKRARELNGTSHVATFCSYPWFKARNARDLNEVSSSLARMTKSSWAVRPPDFTFLDVEYHSSEDDYLFIFSISYMFNTKSDHFSPQIKVSVQRSGIDTIKYHTWPRIPMGKWQTHSRHHLCKEVQINMKFQMLITKMLKIKTFSAFKFSDIVFFMPRLALFG